MKIQHICGSAPALFSLRTGFSKYRRSPLLGPPGILNPLPGLLAYLTIAAELGGGVALIAGIYTRLVSAALIPALLGAACFGHSGNGWGFSNEGSGWEFPVFGAVVTLALAFRGNSAYSVRSLVGKTNPAKNQ